MIGQGEGRERRRGISFLGFPFCPIATEFLCMGFIEVWGGRKWRGVLVGKRHVMQMKMRNRDEREGVERS